MTINEAINQANNLCPNLYTTADKINWLSRLDLRIQRDVIDTHEDGGDTPFTGYGAGDGESELLIGEPWAEMYIHWIHAQIAYYNAEYEKYNAANAMFKAVYSAFAREYNREHIPKGTKRTYF